MTKLRWTFAGLVLILLAANLASTWYAYGQTRDHLDQQTASISATAAKTSATIASALAASDRALTNRLDRNWRMTIAARKAACEAFYGATTLPHYLYPTVCDQANMQKLSYYIHFWRQPTGWNTAN